MRPIVLLLLGASNGGRMLAQSGTVGWHGPTPGPVSLRRMNTLAPGGRPTTSACVFPPVTSVIVNSGRNGGGAASAGRRSGALAQAARSERDTMRMGEPRGCRR
jgi:hypothetical protein